MGDARYTSLLNKVAGYLRKNSSRIAQGWEELIRPGLGEGLDDLDTAAQSNRVLEMMADLMAGADYDSYSNFIRRLFIDLITAGYGPSWLFETWELFVEYLLQAMAREDGAEQGKTENEVTGEYREALKSFIEGEVGNYLLRDIALVLESQAEEVTGRGEISGREKAVLLEISSNFQDALSRREVFTGLLPLVVELIPQAQAGVLMAFDESGALRLMDVHNLDDFQPVKSEVDMRGTIYHDILNHGEERFLEKSRLSDKVDLFFRKATTVGEKVLRAQPLSVLILPFFAGNRCVGGIALFNYQREGSFTEDDLFLLKVVTRQLTVALDRIHYTEESTRQHNRIKTVLEIAESLKRNQTPREVAEIILTVIRRAIDFTRGIIYTGTDSGRLIATGILDVELPMDVRLFETDESSVGMLVLALQREEIIYVEDISSPGPLSEIDLPETLEEVETGSLIVAPLKFDQVLVGLLIMYHPDPHAFDDESLDLIRVICHHTANYIQRSIEYENYLRNLALLEEERTISKRMQSGLAPDSLRRKGWTVKIQQHQGQKFSGDYVAVREVPEGIMVALGDVSGRDQLAGLLMMRAYGLIVETYLEKKHPGKTLDEVNRILHTQFEASSDRLIAQCFVTSMLAEVGAKGNIKIASAGNPPALLYRYATGDVTVIEERGIPLGIDPEQGYAAAELVMEKGDKLLLYTNGLVTGFDISGKPFRSAELEALFARVGQYPPKVILDLLMGTFGDYIPDESRDDDRTAIIVAKENPKRKRLCFKGDDEEREAAMETFLKAVKRRTKDRDILFATRLALHEIVKNAIEHGNQGDISKMVNISYLFGEDFVHVAVSDSGKGFDPKLLREGLGSGGILKDKGRGFFMVKQLMERVWYDEASREVNLFTRLL